MGIVMLIHVAGGSTALLAGAAALAFRKGGSVHLRAGTIFFVAMLVLTISGAAIAAPQPERGTTVIAILTCYLVATSWVTARRRDGATGRFEIAAFAVASGCAFAMAVFGWMAANSPAGRLDSLPASAHYPFAVLAALAAALDLNYMLRRSNTGRQRIARHLWRMCAALLIAAFSFFLGQQDEFPEAIRGPVWFLPPLLVLATMIYWILRVRFARSFRRAGALGAALTPSTQKPERKAATLAPRRSTA